MQPTPKTATSRTYNPKPVPPGTKQVSPARKRWEPIRKTNPIGPSPWARLTLLPQAVAEPSAQRHSVASSASNQITAGLCSSTCYDAAGNVTNGNHTYTYDAENRIIQVDGSTGYCSTGSGTAATACYTYDALGDRVQKITGGVTTSYIYDDNSGQVLTEFQGNNTSWTAGYVYFNGQLLAEYTGGTSGTTYFVHQDSLGSTRLLTNLSGSVCESIDYMPFGEQYVTGTCSSSHRFTGQERDSESGLDNFGARYMSSQYGRFMSADPVGGDITNPQSLNRYAYVGNNPINVTDPTGMDWEDGGSGDFGGGFGGCDWCEQSPINLGGPGGGIGFPGAYNGGGDLGFPGGVFGQGGPSGSGPGCTFGSGSCGGMIYGLDGANAGEVLGGACAIQPETCWAGAIYMTVYGAYLAEQSGIGSAMYSQSERALSTVQKYVNTAVDHLGKLASNPSPDPRRGWKNTVCRSADNIDGIADQLHTKYLRDAAHFTADTLRGAVKCLP